MMVIDHHLRLSFCGVGFTLWYTEGNELRGNSFGGYGFGVFFVVRRIADELFIDRYNFRKVWRFCGWSMSAGKIRQTHDGS